MQPPAVGTPIAPQAVASSPQGVGSVAPIAAPTPPALPTGQAPVGTPPPVAAPNLGMSQQLQNIAAYYQIPRDTARIASAGQAQGAVAQSQFEAQKYQNELNIEHEKDQLDPSKYQLTKNADGSVTAINSMGQKVDIGTYAALTGQNPAEALQKAGATDEASQKFITAYNNLQTYVQDQIAAKNGDEQAKIAVNEFQKANPGLQNLELGQLQSAFMQQYGSYFGAPSANNQNALQQQGVNPTITSRNNPGVSSPYYELQAYPQLAQELSGTLSPSLSGQATNPLTGL